MKEGKKWEKVRKIKQSQVGRERRTNGNIKREGSKWVKVSELIFSRI